MTSLNTSLSAVMASWGGGDEVNVWPCSVRNVTYRSTQHTLAQVVPTSAAEPAVGSDRNRSIVPLLRGTVGSQLALAQQLGIDRPTTTYLLDDLEGSSLIERHPDPADRASSPSRHHPTYDTDLLTEGLMGAWSADAYLLGPLDRCGARLVPRPGSVPRHTDRRSRPPRQPV
jgi:hypothetical protein